MNTKLNRPSPSNFFGIAASVSNPRHIDPSAGVAKRINPSRPNDADSGTQSRNRAAQKSGLRPVLVRPPQTSFIDAEWEVEPLAPAVHDEDEPTVRIAGFQSFAAAADEAEASALAVALQPFAPATDDDGVDSQAPTPRLQPFALVTDESDALQPFAPATDESVNVQPRTPGIESQPFALATDESADVQLSAPAIELQPFAPAAEASGTAPISIRPPQTSFIDKGWEAEPVAAVTHESHVREILVRPPRTSIVDAEWDAGLVDDADSRTEPVDDAQPVAAPVDDAEPVATAVAHAESNTMPANDDDWEMDRVLPPRAPRRRGYMLVALLAAAAFGVIGLSHSSLSHRTAVPQARVLRQVPMRSGAQLLTNTSADHAEPGTKVASAIASVVIPDPTLFTEQTSPPVPEKPKAKPRRISKPKVAPTVQVNEASASGQTDSAETGEVPSQIRNGTESTGSSAESPTQTDSPHVESTNEP